MQQQWQRSLQHLQQNVSTEVYNTWVPPLRPESFDGVMLILGVPSRTFVDMMGKAMGKELVAAVRAGFGEQVRLNWKLSQDDDPNAHAGRATTGGTSASALYTPQQGEAVGDLVSNLNPNYSFVNFCGGQSNLEALNVAKAIVDHPERQTFNPWFLYGPSGVGKTHLVNAVGLALKEKFPQLRVLIVAAEVFRRQYTNAVKTNNTNSFIYFYQTIDVLIIDDYQEINTPKTQQTFFHIFNHLHANGRKILITCDRSPSEFEGIEERMLTRLRWGSTNEIHRPDIGLRRSILDAKLRRENIAFPEDVLQYISEHVSDSVRELQGTVNSMIAFALNDYCAIDLDLARRVVARLVNQVRKELTFDAIVAAVCERCKVKVSDLASKSRKAPHVAARHLTMYLIHKYTNTSFSQIGRSLGGRDHSTVHHACNQFERKLCMDKDFRRDIEAFEATLKK